MGGEIQALVTVIFFFKYGFTEQPRWKATVLGRRHEPPWWAKGHQVPGQQLPGQMGGLQLVLQGTWSSKGRNRRLVQQTPSMAPPRSLVPLLLVFTYLHASGRDWRLLTAHAGCQLGSEQVISAHRAPRERQWRKSPVSPWSKEGEPRETDFSTHFGEVLPENSIEACGVKPLAHISPRVQDENVSCAGFLEQIVSKCCISPN